MGKVLRIHKIKNGTVIDHIAGGEAVNVLKILGITGREGAVISVAMNASSRRLGRKDIVKIEGRELRPNEVDKIALIAPEATINIVRNYGVVQKKPVTLPESIVNIVRCRNPACITNSKEPVKPVFRVVRKAPILLRCDFCETSLSYDEVTDQF